MRIRPSKYLVLMPHDFENLSDLDNYNYPFKKVTSTVGDSVYLTNEFMCEYTFVTSLFKNEYGLNLLSDKSINGVLDCYKAEVFRYIRYHLQSDDTIEYSSTLLLNSANKDGVMVGVYADLVRDKYRTLNRKPDIINTTLNEKISIRYLPHFYLDNFLDNPVVGMLMTPGPDSVINRMNIDRMPMYKEGYGRNIILDELARIECLKRIKDDM